MFRFRTILLILLWLSVAGLFLGYTLFQARFFLRGPQITLYEPNTISYASSTLTVRGRAENIIDISVNDYPITTDPHGNFSTVVHLPLGYSILTLTAHDRFGRTTHVQRELVNTLYGNQENNKNESEVRN